MNLKKNRLDCKFVSSLIENKIETISPDFDQKIIIILFGDKNEVENSEKLGAKFYDYIFSKVKREPGSTDEKVRIVEAAGTNDALSDLIVSKVAKSSPKSLKRKVVLRLLI